MSDSESASSDEMSLPARNPLGLEKCPAPRCQKWLAHSAMAAHTAQCDEYQAYEDAKYALELLPAPLPHNHQEERTSLDSSSLQQEQEVASQNFHFSQSSTDGEDGESGNAPDDSGGNGNIPLSMNDYEQDPFSPEEEFENFDEFPPEDQECILNHDFNVDTGSRSLSQISESDGDELEVSSRDGNREPQADSSQHPLHKKLKSLQEDCGYKEVNPPYPIPKDIQFGIDLLSIIPPKSPLYLYDKIIDLLVEHDPDFFTLAPKRSSLQAALEERYHLGGLKPQVAAVPLTDSASPPSVQVTTSSFVEGVNYLLHHIRDSPPESLLIDADDPFKAPVERFTNSVMLGEFSSGTRFNHAYAACRKRHNKSKAIPLPINLEVDKTHIDATGKLTFEQVRICIPWLTREETYFPAAWVGIGAVPNSVNIPKSHHSRKVAQGLSSNRDYHTIMNHILAEMKEVNRADGLLCDLVLPKLDPSTNKVIYKRYDDVTLYPYLLYVNGDTEGHNKICSLKANSLHNCRICDVLKSESGTPDADFQLREMDKVKALVDKALTGDTNAAERLDSMSIYVTPNSFYEDVEFFQSAHDRAGVFGVCPPELLHYLQKGKYCYVLEGFYEQPKTKHQKQKEKAQKQVASKRKPLKRSENGAEKKQKVRH